MTECKDKVGASAEDVQALTNKQLPTSEKGFCMIECIFTNGGIMKDGKLDVQNTLKVLEPALSKNPDVKKKTTAALETCEKEVGAGGANGCETAKLLAECFKKEAKKQYDMQYVGNDILNYISIVWRN